MSQKTMIKRKDPKLAIETRDPVSHGPRRINTGVTKADDSLSEIGAIDPRR